MAPIKSEFPRLSQSRLQKLLNQYNEIQEESILLERDFRNVAIEKWHNLIPYPGRWSIFYELDYPQHLTFVFYWIGLLDGYVEAIKSDNPINSVLTYIDTIDEITIDPDADPKGGVSNTGAILSWIALNKSLKCWMTFGKTLSKLNAEIAEGSFPAFYKALQIDPSIITTSEASYLFSIGLLKQSKKRYLRTIHNKMNANLGRHNASLEPVRFILTALKEVGDFDRYTQSERYKLFVEDLGIYASTSKNEDTRDEFESLNRFITRWAQSAEYYEYPPQDIN